MKVQKVLTALGLALGVGIAATSHAAVISVNFTDSGGGMGNASADNIAGVVEAGWWETTSFDGARNDTDPNNLRDSTGAYTGVSLSHDMPGGWWTAGTTGFNTPTANQNDKMMENYADTWNTHTVTFSNLTGIYDVYVYAARPEENTGIGAYSIGSEIIYLKANDLTGPFVESGFADPGAAELNADDPGNYIVFRNLDDSTFTLTVSSLGGGVPLNGIQIVAVPEPASVALLGLGGVLVLARRRGH